MATIIVNLRKKRGQPRPSYDAKIDRTTIFGNPHPIGQCNICNKVHDRQDSVNEYRGYFYDRILRDNVFRQKVLELKGLVLACWCFPLLCHGMVIAEYLEAN